MSLQPCPPAPVPEETARVARAVFPKDNPYLLLRDEFGCLFSDEQFADLYPPRGQSALPPWRLALVTVLQFRESLSDRQAAEAVRARIDWKYLLGLELTDPGFDFSVLSEFRSRLLAGSAEERLLDRLLERCRAAAFVKPRDRQRTDSTHVVASIRVLNRLELVAETMRAAVNELATVAPDWLRSIAPPAWYERYGRRIEDTRLPRGRSERERFAVTVGEDGFMLLAWVEAPEAPGGLTTLRQVEILRRVWARHFQRDDGPDGGQRAGALRLRPERALPPAAETIESPYDVEARFRSKGTTHWTGYMVHLSESCDADLPHLITHVVTTTAVVHEARSTAAIHQGLAEKGLPPEEHLADAAYIDAGHLIEARERHGIRLVDPPRKDPSWQSKTEGAYTTDRFEIDWERQQVRCPEGKLNAYWGAYHDNARGDYVTVGFRAADCSTCPARSLCTRSKRAGRSLMLHPRCEHEALEHLRNELDGEEGWRRYAKRAGVEGTISQGVRAFGLRRTRYRGLQKAHLGHVATAAAMNLSRLAGWLAGAPRETTRTSRFLALAA